MLEERRREAERSRIEKKEMKRVKKRPRGRSVDNSSTILAHTEVEESHTAIGDYFSRNIHARTHNIHLSTLNSAFSAFAFLMSPPFVLCFLSTRN